MNRLNHAQLVLVGRFCVVVTQGFGGERCVYCDCAGAIAAQERNLEKNVKQIEHSHKKPVQQERGFVWLQR